MDFNGECSFTLGAEAKCAPRDLQWAGQCLFPAGRGAPPTASIISSGLRASAPPRQGVRWSSLSSLLRFRDPLSPLPSCAVVRSPYNQSARVSLLQRRWISGPSLVPDAGG